MKLTLQYVQKAISKDKRFSKDCIDILEEGQIAVWLNPEYTWDKAEGHRTVEHFSIEDGHNPQDTVGEFKYRLSFIEKAI